MRLSSTARATLLKPAFFNRDPRRVARSLLGKLLIRKTPHGILSGRIVETEAYLGQGDAAAHSAVGRTPRNAVLFGPPGYAYVYFIYGNHYCLNVSCLPDGIPGGVLFRAMEPVSGIDQMAKARGIEVGMEVERERKIVCGRTHSSVPAERSSASGKSRLGAPKECDPREILLLRKISSGPGRMCEALGVTRDRDNAKNFVSPGSDLQLAADGYRVRNVIVTSRIGIVKSADQPLRYFIAGNSFVSRT
jgi:DNA-3-methyladenine glycosylase